MGPVRAPTCTYPRRALRMIGWLGLHTRWGPRRRFHNPTLADPAQAIAYVDREWQPDKVRLRYDWLFEYDATKVSV